MNPAVQAQWMADLRSGDYPQGAGYLTQDNPGPDGGELDCCLGVLCKQAVRAGIVTRVYDPMRKTTGYAATDNTDGADADDATLPRAVMRWAGLDAANPLVGNPAGRPGEVTSLAALNDERTPFASIAVLIGRYL